MLRKWDKGIDFKIMLNELKDSFIDLIKLYYKKERKKQIAKSILYYSIALIQLTNGLRASEAVEALKNYIEHNKAVCRVRKRKDNIEREVIIPNLIHLHKPLLEKIYYEVFNSNIDTNKYKVWCLYNLKTNSHSLRYAFENYISKKIADTSLITLFQGRKSLNSHLHYLRYKEAKELVEKEIKKLL